MRGQDPINLQRLEFTPRSSLMNNGRKLEVNNGEKMGEFINMWKGNNTSVY